MDLKEVPERLVSEVQRVIQVSLVLKVKLDPKVNLVHMVHKVQPAP